MVEDTCVPMPRFVSGTGTASKFDGVPESSVPSVKKDGSSSILEPWFSTSDRKETEGERNISSLLRSLALSRYDQ